MVHTIQCHLLFRMFDTTNKHHKCVIFLQCPIECPLHIILFNFIVVEYTQIGYEIRSHKLEEINLSLTSYVYGYTSVTCDELP